MMRQGLHIAEKAWRWWLSEFLALLPQAYLKRLVSSRLALLLKPSEAITEIAVMTSEKRLLQETFPTRTPRRRPSVACEMSSMRRPEGACSM